MAAYYLSIDGIPGEAMQADHEDEIEVLAWSWGARRDTGSGSTGGRSRLAVDVDELTVHKNLDIASPKLFEAMFAGTSISEAVLTCMRQVPNGQTVEFLRIEMAKVVVVAASDAADLDGATEQIALQFQQLTYTYTQRDPSGAAIGSTSFQQTF